MKIKKFVYDQNPEQLIAWKAREEGKLIGNVGNRGFKRGKVIKLLAKDYYNQEKLDFLRKSLAREKGLVLVTSMARPELASFIKGASAFVTDEGGITCHAAVIAREMNKPCIIGTEVGTLVLNDGDLVEVDADNGIVRILEKVQ